MVTVKVLLSAASTQIAIAFQHSNMQPVKVAQIVLKAGNNKLLERSNKLDVIQSNQQSIRKCLDSCWSVVVIKINLKPKRIQLELRMTS